jgi:hypothetical protein
MDITLILAPLSFLSGIGLIILSTSRRYIELIRQLQHFIEDDFQCTQTFMHLQKNRLWMFKWALSLLYLCVGFVLTGSLAGGFSQAGVHFMEPWLYGSVSLSVLTALAAIIILIKESFISASLIDEQLKNQ